MKRLVMVATAYGLLRSWCWFTYMEGTAADLMASTFGLSLETLAVIFIVGWMFFISVEAFVLKRLVPEYPARRETGRFFRAIGVGACFLMAWLGALWFVPHGTALDRIATFSASAGFTWLTFLCALAFYSLGVYRAAIAQCVTSSLSIVFLLPYLIINNSAAAAIYVFTLIPVLATWLIFRADRMAFHETAVGSGLSSAPEREWSSLNTQDWSNIARYAAVSLVINLCCGTIHGLMISINAREYSKIYYMSDISYFASSLLLGWILYKFPHMRFRTICVFSIPLMAAGFILFPLLARRSPFVCFALIQAGFAFFNIYEWTYVLSITERAGRKNVVTVLGSSLFLWTAMTWLGLSLPTQLMSFFEAAASEHSVVLSLIGSLCLYAAIYLLPEDMQSDEIESVTNEQEAAACVYDENIIDPDARNADEFEGGSETPPLSVPAPIFTRREKVILELVNKGMKNDEICDVIHISENTLRTHLKNIYRKIGRSKREDLASMNQTILHTTEKTSPR
jgi:DNA-binding CsgD family transcriptional regulator